MGTSSTAAIDLERGVVYVISADGWLMPSSSGPAPRRADGRSRSRPRTSELEYVWGGLRLFRNTLYVPVASYCDAGDEDEDENEESRTGRLVAVDVDRATQTAVFDPVPARTISAGSGDGAGLHDPAGSSSSRASATRTSTTTTAAVIVDDAGYGDSVVKLTPDLRVTAAGSPRGVPETGDLDFGSAPLLFRPAGCPPLAAANSKIGAVFIWNRNAMRAGPIANTRSEGSCLRRAAELLAGAPDDLRGGREPAVDPARGR